MKQHSLRSILFFMSLILNESTLTLMFVWVFIYLCPLTKLVFNFLRCGQRDLWNEAKLLRGNKETDTAQYITYTFVFSIQKIEIFHHKDVK